jgi:hypothetical protein
MPSQHSQRDIGLQEPTKQHQNTTCSGYCTKAATPFSGIFEWSQAQTPLRWRIVTIVSAQIVLEKGFLSIN